MEQQSHRAPERTKSKQKQNQVTSHSNWLRVLLFDLAVVSLKDDFTVWRQTQKEDFLSVIFNVWLSMISSHGANPIFFKKKKKRLDVQNKANSPHTYDRQYLIFALPIPPPYSPQSSHPTLLKVDVISVSPLILWKSTDSA